jgi:hypothetical protein
MMKNLKDRARILCYVNVTHYIELGIKSQNKRLRNKSAQIRQKSHCW